MWQQFTRWWQAWCASLVPQRPHFYRDDAVALRADFEAVAGDMRRAMERFEREHPELFQAQTTEQEASDGSASTV